MVRKATKTPLAEKIRVGAYAAVKIGLIHGLDRDSIRRNALAVMGDIIEQETGDLAMQERLAQVVRRTIDRELGG